MLQIVLYCIFSRYLSAKKNCVHFPRIQTE
uniref:Uncharacterized protein n=1 Tax=Podoviridae sp. ct90d35 TaxID=2827724 RepID=A0A8S5TNH1_9CAUD|nr:MAG TPA: hypothetical protein [Podoviridae sp. ct90d35]